jgi:hypothetical protein
MFLQLPEFSSGESQTWLSSCVSDISDTNSRLPSVDRKLQI